MFWTNNAIVLSARPFGEGKAIVSLFAAEHGCYRGVVPGATAGRGAIYCSRERWWSPHGALASPNSWAS
ncbi:recombination protein O N-terminal domain-containing protein [Defluviicoccus vanus]|uniref:Recombination protein O N-terminal domain-containing protein n=1 Tax=Defluviicoccus vanus TaxID=111831 RepID=A0A7H1N4P8_9PROT|nr:recombination protein O N-terminal domain-containing protein [Defluviicoccus vanus]QNT70684.1 recombination protein O N-terminal domain-containing protein [Defluviicoccus vanus]